MTIEERLARLERTNRQYRLGLAAALVALGGMTLAGFGQQQVQQYPRNIFADSIQVTSITAGTGNIDRVAAQSVAAEYVSGTQLEATNATLRNARVNQLLAEAGAVREVVTQGLAVNDDAGATRVQLSGQAGGRVAVLGAGRRALAELASEGSSGRVAVYSTSGPRQAELRVANKAGQLRVFAGERLAASVGASDQGLPLIVAHTRNGNRGVLLTTDSEGRNGQLTVQQDDGFPLVQLRKAGTGGEVVAYGAKNEVRAKLPAE